MSYAITPWSALWSLDLTVVATIDTPRASFVLVAMGGDSNAATASYPGDDSTLIAGLYHRLLCLASNHMRAE